MGYFLGEYQSKLHSKIQQQMDALIEIHLYYNGKTDEIDSILVIIIVRIYHQHYITPNQPEKATINNFIANILQKISLSQATLISTDMNNDTINNNNNPLPVKGILTGQEDVIVTINTNTYGSNKAMALSYVVMQLQ
eukprot:176318_1